jgi:hypothetical protein
MYLPLISSLLNAARFVGRNAGKPFQANLCLDFLGRLSSISRVIRTLRVPNLLGDSFFNLRFRQIFEAF